MFLNAFLILLSFLAEASVPAELLLKRSTGILQLCNPNRGLKPRAGDSRKLSVVGMCLNHPQDSSACCSDLQARPQETLDGLSLRLEEPEAGLAEGMAETGQRKWRGDKTTGRIGAVEATP